MVALGGGLGGGLGGWVLCVGFGGWLRRGVGVCVGWVGGSVLCVGVLGVGSGVVFVVGCFVGWSVGFWVVGSCLKNIVFF